MAEQAEPKNYKDTLNLPQTDFPMKANLSQKEPEILNEWQKTNLYQEIISKNKNRPVFSMPDGPPYANGDLHLGQMSLTNR